MKLALVLMTVAQLATSVALAADVAIECKALEEASQGSSAAISGTLQVTEHAQEFAAVEGMLRVVISGSNFDTEVKVSGARLEDGSISLAASEDQSIAMIYINSEGKDLSGIEKDGTRYSSNCMK